ncbi:MAG: energy-coupling factor transporter transmembrane protein EcfT [Geoalkalibacter sp.]|uniref:energy-coupling factor transporter transmembrane component T family protein n=1 Tax=Geoalkalibacter sp. TaxID=3041440 RepID=UPI003D124D04
MAFLDDLTLGRYHPGDSLMHRLDSRLKLVMVSVLIAAVFSAPGFVQLSVLAALTLALMALSAIAPVVWWRGLWFFRWFFLFTLVLHLLFTPGHTLFGIEFLSQDGLKTGLTVILRLCLAVCLASLLSLTVDASCLARAGVDLLRPLARFGIPVERWGAFSLLILNFLPLLRQELNALVPRARALASAGFRQRLDGLRDLLSTLLFRLCDHADTWALQMARGESVQSPCPAVKLKPLPVFVQIVVSCGVFGVVGVLWLWR